MNSLRCPRTETVFLRVLSTVVTIILCVNPKILTKYLDLYIFSIKSTIIILLLIALYLAFMFFRHYRIMEDTPTSKIRSCAQGFVELEGIQDNLPEQIILGKLSQKKYTWYSYTIEKYCKSANGKSNYWQTIEKVTSEQPFRIEDITGNCIIIPSGALVQTPYKLIWRGFSKMPTYVPQSNKCLNIKHSFVGNYRYTEYYMLPRTPIYALGMFHTKNKQNYLTNLKLPDNSPFVLSAIPQSKLIKKNKIKFFIYLLLFFILVMVYPVTAKYYFCYWQWLANNLSINVINTVNF